MVNYRGTLLNEQEFDSSAEPITFPLNRVIPGWTEGVQLMSVGSTYQFFIPAELAYGDNPPPRSEEHTSELQSRGHLVCRLLLEKKKQCGHQAPHGAYRRQVQRRAGAGEHRRRHASAQTRRSGQRPPDPAAACAARPRHGPRPPS